MMLRSTNICTPVYVRSLPALHGDCSCLGNKLHDAVSTYSLSFQWLCLCFNHSIAMTWQAASIAGERQIHALRFEFIAVVTTVSKKG
jgi:hypothetical protein